METSWWKGERFFGSSCQGCENTLLFSDYIIIFNSRRNYVINIMDPVSVPQWAESNPPVQTKLGRAYRWKSFFFPFSYFQNVYMPVPWCLPPWGVFSSPRVMCLISSVSKEPFSFCHCQHPPRNPKRSLTFLPSPPIVFTQMLIAPKAAVRPAF